MTNADAAVYHSKKLGGGQVHCYNKKLSERYIRDTQIKHELSSALANQEFTLNFQPIMNRKTAGLYGFEGLIRWHNKKLGFVSPAEFIPIAEESGQIVAIGEWVLEHGLKVFHDLRKGRNGISKRCVLSLNISAIQFKNEKFVTQILTLLKKYEINPNRLLIELTETTLIENIDAIRNILIKMNEAKMQVTLDDFGSGYSSLTYIQQLPVNIIKIDKAFIDGIEQEKSASAIVKTIINLAKNINAKVIAEGVETHSQLKILAALGCEYIQGYYYAKPMALDTLKQWLKDHKH